MANTDDISGDDPFSYMMLTAIDAVLRQSMFTLPGRITTFDPDTQLAQVELGIKDRDGEVLPVVESVPVCFPGDGEWYFWHQITPGETEGLIHFSQRAVDTWIDQGGPVSAHEHRILSPDDAFFEPGYRSTPSAIPNFRNDGAGLSNYSGTAYIHLTDSGAEIQGDVTVTGNYDITGDIDAEGDYNLTGNLTVSGNADAATYSVAGTQGVSGTFTTADSPSKTVTVTSGIITAIA